MEDGEVVDVEDEGECRFERCEVRLVATPSAPSVGLFSCVSAPCKQRGAAS